MKYPLDNRLLFRSAEGYPAVMDHYDRTLSTLRIAIESTYVDTSQGPTHVIAAGNTNDPPVLLVHGQNANATSWIHWLPALAPFFRVYAMDVIGGMGKSAPSRPAKKSLAYGEWFVDVLDGLQLENAHMVGASQGCWIILKATSLAPHRIRSSVLMSPAGFRGISLRQTLQMIPSLLFKPTSEAARAMLAVVSAPGVPPDPLFVELFELMLRHFRSEALVPLLSDDELARLRAPTYLLVGEHEKTMNPYKVLHRALETLPGLKQAEIVPGVGHSMQHSDPDWVTSRVLSFITSSTT